MATESFFEDMIIDTPEAAENLTRLIESGKSWKRGNSEYKVLSVEDLRRIKERSERKR